MARADAGGFLPSLLAPLAGLSGSGTDTFRAPEPGRRRREETEPSPPWEPASGQQPPAPLGGRRSLADGERAEKCHRLPPTSIPPERPLGKTGESMYSTPVNKALCSAGLPAPLSPLSLLAKFNTRLNGPLVLPKTARANNARSSGRASQSMERCASPVTHCKYKVAFGRDGSPQPALSGAVRARRRSRASPPGRLCPGGGHSPRAPGCGGGRASPHRAGARAPAPRLPPGGGSRPTIARSVPSPRAGRSPPGLEAPVGHRGREAAEPPGKLHLDSNRFPATAGSGAASPLPHRPPPRPRVPPSPPRKKTPGDGRWGGGGRGRGRAQ